MSVSGIMDKCASSFRCLAQVSRRLQNQHIQAFHEVWKIFV